MKFPVTDNHTRQMRETSLPAGEGDRDSGGGGSHTDALNPKRITVTPRYLYSTTPHDAKER